MSFEQDLYNAHHAHPIETISIAAYAPPRTPIELEIECRRCNEILFHMDSTTALPGAFDALLVHVGHGAEVIGEGAVLVCKADGVVLTVAE